MSNFYFELSNNIQYPLGICFPIFAVGDVLYYFYNYHFFLIKDYVSALII